MIYIIIICVNTYQISTYKISLKSICEISISNEYSNNNTSTRSAELKPPTSTFYLTKKTEINKLPRLSNLHLTRLA